MLISQCDQQVWTARLDQQSSRGRLAIRAMPARAEAKPRAMIQHAFKHFTERCRPPARRGPWIRGVIFVAETPDAENLSCRVAILERWHLPRTAMGMHHLSKNDLREIKKHDHWRGDGEKRTRRGRWTDTPGRYSLRRKSRGDRFFYSWRGKKRKRSNMQLALCAITQKRAQRALRRPCQPGDRPGRAWERHPPDHDTEGIFPLRLGAYLSGPRARPREDDWRSAETGPRKTVRLTQAGLSAERNWRPPKLRLRAS